MPGYSERKGGRKIGTQFETSTSSGCDSRTFGTQFELKDRGKDRGEKDPNTGKDKRSREVSKNLLEARVNKGFSKTEIGLSRGQKKGHMRRKY